MQKIKHSIPADERSERASYSRWSTGNDPMFSAGCQAERRGFVTGISIYEFGPNRSNEKFLWKRMETHGNRQKTEAKRFSRIGIPCSWDVNRYLHIGI